MLLSTHSKAVGILLSVGACAVLSLTNCGCTQIKSEELELQGVEMMKHQEFAKAIEKFTASIKLDPDRDLSYIRRGNAYLCLDQYESALADFNKALSFKDEPDQHRSVAYEDRGLLYLNTGRFKEGLEDETNSIKVLPDPDAYVSRGRCKTALNDFHGALSDYEEGVKLDPNNVIGLGDIGVGLIDLKDYKGAIKHLNRVLEMKMDDQTKSHMYVLRGIAEYASHDYKGTVADDDKALQLVNNDSEALNDRGSAKLAMGDKSGAEKDFAAAKKATYHYKFFQAHMVKHPEMK
jgi:tetratricopeptide (TPR) repeat protein